MKALTIFSFLTLLFIPSLALTHIPLDMGTPSFTHQVSKLSFERTVDISMLGNVYFSNPDIVNGEIVDIYGIVRNDGGFRVSSYVLFTIKNSSWEQDIASQRVNLAPNEEQYVKTSWMGVKGTHEIIIKAQVMGYIDDFPENNIISTVVNISPELHTDDLEASSSTNNPTVKELQSSDSSLDVLDLSIFELNHLNSIYEIKPGDTKSLDLTILSNQLSDEFRVIVGGITNEISIIPNHWILPLLQGQEYDLKIDVSVSESLDIGSSHVVELLLYRSLNPSDIIQKSFFILIVSDYTESLENNNEDQNLPSDDESETPFSPRFSVLSINEVNPPTIENITHTPASPRISQNVTVNADIVDDSTLSNATLFYSLTGGSTWLNVSMIPSGQNNWSGEIISPGYEVNVTYFIQSYDNFTNLGSSSQYYLIFDDSFPLFVDVTNPGIVSSQTSVNITTHLTDNVGINTSAVFLYYSYDNSSYFMTQMTQLNGSAQDGYYDGVIPATTNSLVYYFINSTDLSGLTNSSALETYTTDTPPSIISMFTTPLFPQVNRTTTVYVNITDDSGILFVNLQYSFNGTSQNLTMTDSAGLYNATIPATINDTYVNFTISILDSFGHNVTSINYSYYSDGILPSLGEVIIDDYSPNYTQNVTVTTQADDINELRNVTLFYSLDGGNNWFSVNMTGTSGSSPGSIVKDVLLVSHGQNTGYLTRNGFTFDSITEVAFSSITISTLIQYRILILEPNWSNYATLRNGLSVVNQALDNHSLAVSIRAAGNQDSQADIDFLGTDYDRSITHNIELFVDGNHPFITGLPWSGNTLLTTYFDSWGWTDHGVFTSLPTTQEGYTEIIQNVDGISMLEYKYKDSLILLDTLTSIDGTWGSGNPLVADNFVNYLNYSYYQQKPSYQGIIPSAPADTLVQYYVNATDVANNSGISEILSYFSDGSIPQIKNVTEIITISELDPLVINATISDNWALDNTTAFLVYTYDNNTYYQALMTQITGNETNAVYQAISPATSQAIVYYYIEITDLSGLLGQSGNYSYLVDRIPTLNSQLTIPIFPHANFTVTINATVSDDNGISSVILYYSSNSTWDQIGMNLNQGVYQGTIPETVNDTNVDYIISMTDTFGHQINTSLFSYYSDGLAPIFTNIAHTPTQPNADAPVLIQAIITDLSGIQNATLSYSTDSGFSWANLSMNFNTGSWEASIPALNQSVEVYYFVTAYDQAGIVSESNQTIFETDIESPQIYNLTEVGTISELLSVPINVTLTDNFGIDSSNVLLFYSYDNSSWFSSAMSLITGDTLNGTFNGNSPPSIQDSVYYYVQAFDLSGRLNVSSILNYTIDHQPDFGISQVNLYYFYNSTWQQTVMTNVSNQYTGTIGFTDMDTQVSYYISVVDSIGHIVNTSTLMYYADGLNPRVENISYLPSFPTSTDDVTVKVDVADNQNILNTTLYYTTNGTWVGINVTTTAAITITGRDPTSGYYYGTTQTTDYDTGELERLAIYVYSADSDTLYVTLWGFRIDTEVCLPEQNWATPIYEQWRIQIYDSENNDNFYYSYEYDVQLGYEAIIPATNSSSTVQFYIEAFDNAGNRGNSSIFSYYTDADVPSWSNITVLSTVSELTGATINATISDNFAVDTNQVILFYSYDQSTWFNGFMSLSSGTNLSGIYSGFIPATSEPIVYYFINATDVSGLTNQTSIFNYNIDFMPILNEVIVSPLYPNPSTSSTIFANITDDTILTSVTLLYEYTGSSGVAIMTESGGLYETTVPATAVDSLVNLSLIIVDSFGHNITKGGFAYYSDGNAPIFQRITTVPAYPNYLHNVTVVAEIDDVNDMRNVTLYYSLNSGSTWTSVNMNGSLGTRFVVNPVADVLLVSHGQDTTYLTRNGYTFDTITEFQFSTITTATLSQYRMLILEPNWSNYGYLRSGLAVVDQALDETSLVVSIRVAGNGGSQADIDLLGTDYDRTTTSAAETILVPNHPFINGLPWGGNTLLASYFNSWSSTDHGWFYNLPDSQPGYIEILQNSNGISMFEYSYKDSHILVDTLTSIDGGWGTGNDIVADNYINYLNYSYSRLIPGYSGTIPVAPADTIVQYYIEATDLANNSQNSGLLSYLIDGGAPLISDVTQVTFVSQLDSVLINATVSDGLSVDNSSVLLVYTYDNFTYYQSPMVPISGNNTFGVYQGVSPATSQPRVYYFISATDISELLSYSGNFSYRVDLLPFFQNLTMTPTYLSSSSDIFVLVEVTDDIGIANASIYYSYNSTWDNLPLAQQGSNYEIIIPALNVNATLTYYFEVFDTFGHQITSAQDTRYVDGILPLITDISRLPDYPINDTSVNISSTFDDINPIINKTLFYSVNGSNWISVNMNQSMALAINGRDPISGYYYGTTRTTDYDTGELERLAIYVYSADTDTLYVTLWGFRIDTGVWEQFYYSGSRGTGNLPEFNWATPIYNQWRIQIYDSENNDDFYYSFDYDFLRKFAQIPGFSQGTNVTYFIQAFDASGNHAESVYYSYIVDGTSPTVTNVTQVNIAPAIDPVGIDVIISDRGGINESLALLYYSFDNTSWFISGFNFTSSTYTYPTLDVNITLQSPTEFVVLNGTILVNFEFLVNPNTSIVEISFNQGGSWINMTNSSGDLFIHTLDTSTVSEGLFDVWINVTVIPGVSLIRTYTYYVDRSLLLFLMQLLTLI
ncbi:MAG: hypothetical protein ACW98G_13445 [Candidatus Hodarchaeales archaeon]|jgi:hypothetical protein